MDWRNLQQKHIHQDPVPHIHAINLMDTLEYDRLYENQKNLNHRLWQEFDEKYKIGFEFKEDITEIDTSRDVIAIWCFAERSDRTRPPNINLAGKKIAYYPNAVIVTESKEIKVEENNNKYIRRPFVQLDLVPKKFREICQLTKKN